jgi:CPA1 family monovalent cation:H+ antiporter
MSSSVYDVVVFGLESVIFALIGLVTAGFVRDLPTGERTEALGLVLAVTVTLLGVRALGLVAGATVPRTVRRPRSGDPTGPRAWGAAAVVTWAGARGVIPLAAALSVPLTVDGGGRFPHRPLLLVVATGAVVISLVVQGSTLEPLVRRAGLAGEQRAHAEQVRRARYATLSAALSALPQVAHGSVAPGSAANRLREDLERQLDRLQAAMSSPHPVGDVEDYRRLRRRLLEVEGEELARLRAAGEVDAETYRTVLRHLDLEHARETAVADVARPDRPLSD